MSYCLIKLCLHANTCTPSHLPLPPFSRPHPRPHSGRTRDGGGSLVGGQVCGEQLGEEGVGAAQQVGIGCLSVLLLLLLRLVQAPAGPAAGAAGAGGREGSSYGAAVEVREQLVFTADAAAPASVDVHITAACGSAFTQQPTSGCYFSSRQSQCRRRPRSIISSSHHHPGPRT